MRSVKLKVGELTGREDFGRGIARLSSKAMNEIGVKEGDIFEIKGNSKTAVIALRAYSADAGDNIIRIDGLVRRNAGASIGEILNLRKAEVKSAKKVVLAPVDKNILFHVTSSIVKQDISMRPFTKGDVFVANPAFKRKENYGNAFEHFFGYDFSGAFVGSGETRLKVVNTFPKGYVQITDATEIEIHPCSQDVGEDILFSSKSKMPVPLFVTMEWKGENQRFKRISKSFSREAVNEYLSKNKERRDELVCFHLNGKWWIFRKVGK